MFRVSPKNRNFAAQNIKMEIKDEILLLAKKIIPKDGHLWLYGSQARGNAHEESDWDLLVLLNKDAIVDKDYDDFVYPFRELGWKLSVNISPILYAKSDWDKYSYSLFYKNVEQDKIEMV